MSLDTAYLALGELERTLTQYEERLKGIEDAWRAFSEAALKIKANWDADLPKLRIRIDQLRNVVESLKREEEVLLAKKELGLISEKDYEALTAELKKKTEEYMAKLEELTEKVAQLEGRVIFLWAKALTKDYLGKFDLVELEKKIEDAKTAGKIDDETYAKIKHEIAIMKASWELLNLLS